MAANFNRPDNLHSALQFNASTGEPELRVSLGSETITITGSVNVGTVVEVSSTPANPVHTHVSEVGTSGILTVPYMPVGLLDATGHVNDSTHPVYVNFTNSTLGVTQSGTWNVGITGSVAATQSGTWNVNVSSIPEVEIKNDSGNPISISATTAPNTEINPIYTEISNDAGNPVPVSFNTSPNGIDNPLWMGLGDTVNMTAFSRLRVAEARCIGDYRYMYAQGTTPLMNDFLAAGGSIVNDYARDCILMSVTGATGSRAVRQTKKYHPYISGTSNVGYMTFCLTSAITGLTQSVGLFDDLNGIFFRLNGTIPQFVIRKNGVDNEVVSQNSWNQNTMFGLDFSKTQILYIDYQWLGVGRVRVGFVNNGVPVICHEFNHNNVTTEVYMMQPSLPVRYEIANTSNTGVSSTMMAICSSVYIEGSTTDISYTKSVSNGNAGVLTVPDEVNGYCVLAIRLQNTLVGKPNRSFAMIKGMTAISDINARAKLVILPSTSHFAAAPTWTDVPGYSWCQFSTGNAMAPAWSSADDFWVLKDTPMQGAGGNNSSIPITPVLDNMNNSIYQNYDSTGSQVFALIIYSSNAAQVRASFEWLEIK